MSGGSKQDKAKKEVHAVDLSLPPERPPWADRRDSSDPAWDDTAACPVPIESHLFEAQVYHRTRRDPEDGRIVDFAAGVQIRQAETDEGWVDVARVDCAHDEVHVDRTLQNGDTEKDATCIPVDCRDNLDRAFEWALEYVWDYQARLEGWI